MFKLETDPTFTKDVMLLRPGERPAAVRFRFRYFEPEALAAMIRESSELGEDNPTFFARFVDGWEGKGIDAAFSQETLGQLLTKYPKNSRVIFEAFTSELLDAPIKN